MGVGLLFWVTVTNPLTRRKRTNEKGVLGSINHKLEIDVAQAITEMVPCAEMIKFCKSGGEADAVAVRIARGYTGKDKVVFCGYQAGMIGIWLRIWNRILRLTDIYCPAWRPKACRFLCQTCLPFEYNNLDQLESVLKNNSGQVACIIMEATRL